MEGDNNDRRNECESVQVRDSSDPRIAIGARIADSRAQTETENVTVQDLIASDPPNESRGDEGSVDQSRRNADPRNGTPRNPLLAMLPLRGRTLDRRFLYLAASWLLFVGGCVLVGLWALATLDTRLYQHQQSAALERAIAARFAAAGEGPSASAVRVGPADAARAAADAGGVIGRIAAPRLGISAIIAEGIDKRTLRRAVGHVPGTAFPGEEGNVGLAGHRDSFFRGLKDVCADDSLTLTTPDGDFHYRVESTEIVDPDRGDVLASEGGATLTLVTCYPFFYVGHAPSRFIVRARLISADRPYEAPMPPPKQYTPEEMTSVEDPAPPPAT